MGNVIQMKNILVNDVRASFEAFWDLYPRHVAKAHALKMWMRLTPADRAAALHAIQKHIEYWNAAGREKERIPHAGTWLNPIDGRRWEDEIEMPEAKTPQAEWWKSDLGIEAKGKELGMPAYGNESYPQYRDRLMSAVRAGRRAA